MRLILPLSTRWPTEEGFPYFRDTIPACALMTPLNLRFQNIGTRVKFGGGIILTGGSDFTVSESRLRNIPSNRLTTRLGLTGTVPVS